jgi:hypothetical protein
MTSVNNNGFAYRADGLRCKRKPVANHPKPATKASLPKRKRLAATADGL